MAFSVRATAILLTMVFVSSADTAKAQWNITQLTDNIYAEGHPQISGSNIAWEGYDGSDWEIFFYDGVSTIQLTNDGRKLSGCARR